MVSEENLYRELEFPGGFYEVTTSRLGNRKYETVVRKYPGKEVIETQPWASGMSALNGHNAICNVLTNVIKEMNNETV